MNSAENDIVRTRRVRFTSGPLGLVSADDPRYFLEETVSEGDDGELIVSGPMPFDVPEGWVLVKVGELYCPVHPSMIEVYGKRGEVR